MRERHRHLELVPTGTDDYVYGSSVPMTSRKTLESKIDLLIARIDSLEDEVESLRSQRLGFEDGWTPALKEAFEKHDLEGFLREIPPPGPECFKPTDDIVTWDDFGLKVRELHFPDELNEANEAESN